MDLNQLLHRHQLSLMQADAATSPEERRAHRQFASDYADTIRTVRNELGAPAAVRGSLEEQEVAHEISNNEGGHVSCVTARVVLIPTGDLPYKVVVSRDGEECSEHSFSNMREAEAFIRENTPSPAARCTLYDREAGEV